MDLVGEAFSNVIVDAGGQGDIEELGQVVHKQPQRRLSSDLARKGNDELFSVFLAMVLVGDGISSVGDDGNVGNDLQTQWKSMRTEGQGRMVGRGVSSAVGGMVKMMMILHVLQVRWLARV